MVEFILNRLDQLVIPKILLASNDSDSVFPQFNTVYHEGALSFIGKGEIGPESLEVLTSTETLGKRYISDEARLIFAVA